MFCVVTVLSWVPAMLTSVFPATLSFTALAIPMSLLLTLAFGVGFGCLLALDYRRLINSRYSLFPCYVNKAHKQEHPTLLEQVPAATPTTESIPQLVSYNDTGDLPLGSTTNDYLPILDKVVQKYAIWVTTAKTYYHFLVLIVFAVVYALCIIGITMRLEKGSDLAQLYGPRGRVNTIEYMNQLSTEFSTTAVSVLIIIDPGVNYADTSVQQSLDDLVSLLQTSEYTTGQLLCWWPDFKEYLNSTSNQTGWSAPSNDPMVFMAQVRFFLSNPLYAAVYGNTAIRIANIGYNGAAFINVTTCIAYQLLPDKINDAASLMVCTPTK